jgi:hypothetical protein
MKTNIYLWLYLAQFFLEWKMFQIKFVEKIKTNIYAQKHITARQATGDNIACVYFTLDT